MHEPLTMTMIHERYTDLVTWWRLDLEAYAIMLTHNAALRGATKIRLLQHILLAEFGV
jgi:hypothetical protein